MKCVHLQQKSPEWKRWRLDGITATDTPVILGCSPYKTPWRLWAEKVQLLRTPDLSHVPAIQWGIAHEDVARSIYEQRFNEILLPFCATWDANPIFRASFDGIDSNGMPVEIKCPGEKTLEDVKARKRDSDAFKLYYGQVQHQMMVAESDKARLIFYDSDANDIVGFEIIRDDAFIKRIQTEGQAFFECVQSRKAPERDPSRDMFIPQSEDDKKRWLLAAGHLVALEAKIQEKKLEMLALESSLKQYKNDVIAIMGDNDCVADYGGIAVRKSIVTGKVDYKQMVCDLLGREPKEEELKKYHKDDTIQWRFRSTGVASLEIIDEKIIEDIESHACHLEPSLWF